MPPRVSPRRLQTVSTSPTFRTRPQCICEVVLSLRQFHASSRTLEEEEGTTVIQKRQKKMTLLKRNMYAWLEGPGAAFKNPLPGSTNYLGAYDRNGKLLRARGKLTAAADIDVIPLEQEPELQAREEEEGLDEVERAGRLANREALRAQKQRLEQALDELPREGDRDLQPFPLNPDFRSEAVLSEDLRRELYRQVVDRGVDITTVSAAFGVDIRRVAAVVRLMTIETQWKEQGKPLATAYNKAVLEMLPKTPFQPDKIVPHESINDLPVHPHTRSQLFLPVSESRQFTRQDAAKAFSPTLLPADERIPHPELIVLEKEHLSGVDRTERIRRQAERDEVAAAKRAAAEAQRKAWEAEKIRVVPSRRWDFQFEDISADIVGRSGRNPAAIGTRYGSPHTDRKKAQVKIPTKVE